MSKAKSGNMCLLNQLNILAVTEICSKFTVSLSGMSEENENKDRIVHQLDFDEDEYLKNRKRRKYKKKVKTKSLYRKKSNLRRKVKKRWIHNQRSLATALAIVFLVIPILIALFITINKKLNIVPWLNN